MPWAKGAQTWRPNLASCSQGGRRGHCSTKAGVRERVRDRKGGASGQNPVGGRRTIHTALAEIAGPLPSRMAPLLKR